MDLQHGVNFSVHGIRIVHSLVFCEVFCRSLSFCPIYLCHCIVYPSSTCNYNDLFRNVKLFVDYLSRIDLWDEMWITSTRMVIRGKILNKSDRMDLYCIGWNFGSNLHVKEDIFDRVVLFCIAACMPLNISLLICYFSGLLQGVWYFLTLGTNNSFREGTDQPSQRLLITIKKAVAIWVGMK
jgi:hypothetical protein